MVGDDEPTSPISPKGSIVNTLRVDSGRETGVDGALWELLSASQGIDKILDGRINIWIGLPQFS